MAFQNATVGLQELAIYAQIGVGILHAVLIGFGLWMMHRASKDRNRTMDDDRARANQHHREAMSNSQARHTEAMTVLKELIARTGASPPPSAA